MHGTLTLPGAGRGGTHPYLPMPLSFSCSEHFFTLLHTVLHTTGFTWWTCSCFPREVPRPSCEHCFPMCWRRHLEIQYGGWSLLSGWGIRLSIIVWAILHPAFLTLFREIRVSGLTQWALVLLALQIFAIQTRRGDPVIFPNLKYHPFLYNCWPVSQC